MMELAVQDEIAHQYGYATGDAGGSASPATAATGSAS
jgi:hypothetical protein